MEFGEGQEEVSMTGQKKRDRATETGDAQPPSKKPVEKEEPQAQLDEAEEELEKEKAKADDYLRRLQYLQADFENYRKRVEKEMSDNRQFGNQRLLSDLIIVNDELELALREAEESKENPTILEGVGMVHKRLQTILSKEGLEKIQSAGSKFNPNLHDAPLQLASDETRRDDHRDKEEEGHGLKSPHRREGLYSTTALGIHTSEDQTRRRDVPGTTNKESSHHSPRPLQR